MSEWRLFEPGTVPEWTTPAWYAGRDTAPHLDEPAHRGRMELASEFVATAVDTYGCGSVVDLGCGDGGLLSLVARHNRVTCWGYDLQPSNVAAAREKRGHVSVEHGDVVSNPDSVVWGDCAVATEMLEHLLDPHGFVQWVYEHARVLVASSPFTETDQSHYPFHCWAWDVDGYMELVGQAGFEVVKHRTVDMFQVVMGVKT